MRGFFLSAVVPFSNTALFRYVWCLLPTALAFATALLASCCCCRSKRTLLCCIACVAGLAGALHVQQNLRAFSGNERDRLRFPAPRDTLFAVLLGAPLGALLLALGVGSPRSEPREREKRAPLL